MAVDVVVVVVDYTAGDVVVDVQRLESAEKSLKQKHLFVPKVRKFHRTFSDRLFGSIKTTIV